MSIYALPRINVAKRTSGGGFRPRALARSQRSRRVTPINGPYSYDLERYQDHVSIVILYRRVEKKEYFGVHVEDSQYMVYFLVAFTMN